MSNITRLVIGTPTKFWDFLKADILRQEISAKQEMKNPRKQSHVNIGQYIDQLDQIQTAQELSWRDLEKFVSEMKTKINIEFVTPSSSKKYLPIAELTQAQKFAQQKPNLSKKNYLILGPMEFLRLDSQNKILKIVEEPPLNLNIYLVTSLTESVLIPTVLSRVQAVHLEVTTPSIPEEILELVKLGVSNKQDSLIASARLEEKLKNCKTSQDKQELWQSLSDAIKAVMESYTDKLSVWHNHSTNSTNETSILTSESRHFRVLKTLETIGGYLKKAEKYNANHNLRWLRVSQEFVRLYS